MAKFVAITQTEHAGKAWRRPANFAFAATQALVPLALIEFTKADIALLTKLMN